MSKKLQESLVDLEVSSTKYTPPKKMTKNQKKAQAKRLRKEAQKRAQKEQEKKQQDNNLSCATSEKDQPTAVPTQNTENRINPSLDDPICGNTANLNKDVSTNQEVPTVLPIPDTTPPQSQDSQELEVSNDIIITPISVQVQSSNEMKTKDFPNEESIQKHEHEIIEPTSVPIEQPQISSTNESIPITESREDLPNSNPATKEGHDDSNQTPKLENATQQQDKEKNKQTQSTTENTTLLFDGRHTTTPPTGTSPSVEACLYAFTEPEVLEGDNGFGCYECTKRFMLSNNQDISELVRYYAKKESSNSKRLKSEKNTTATSPHNGDTVPNNQPEQPTQTINNANKEASESTSTNQATEVPNQADNSQNTQADNTPFNKTDTTSQTTVSVGLTSSDASNNQEIGKNKEEGESDSESSIEEKPNIKLVKSRATKQFLIHRQPQILTLHLKRFMQTMHGFKKVDTVVSFPKVLDLRPYSPKQESPAGTDLPRYMYRLYGVVNHMGGLNNGHYTAYVHKHISGKEEWYYFSDTKFHKTDESSVLSSEAYLLFYERFAVT